MNMNRGVHLHCKGVGLPGPMRVTRTTSGAVAGEQGTEGGTSTDTSLTAPLP